MFMILASTLILFFIAVAHVFSLLWQLKSFCRFIMGKVKVGLCVAQSDLEKAEEFNGQFTDVFSKTEHTQVPLLNRSAPFMNDIAVS